MAAELVKMTEPGLLDSTGQEMLEEMRIQNAYLALLAQDKITTLDSTWDKVAALVRAGHGKAVYGIGDKFIDTWTDKANNNKEYNDYTWRVDHHGDVELENGDIVPGMYLATQWTHPVAVQFCQYQAFYYAEEELAAGTYYVTLGYNWGSKDCVKGASFCFTLTKPVPKGGKLAGFRRIADDAYTSWDVRTYDKDSKTVLETVKVSKGVAGTCLINDWGAYYSGEGNINGLQRTAYGYGRWSQSAIRQYLNSDAGVGAWWTPQNKFDVAPDNLDTTAGYLSGLPVDLLAAIKPVKVVTYTNTCETADKAQAMDVTYDRVFLPSLEEMYIKPQAPVGGEGTPHDYWRIISGSSQPVAQYGTYPRYKQFALTSKTSAQNVRLRSATRGVAYNTWYVGTSGNVSNDYAIWAIACAPLVVIC
nr:MAG TPA: Peptide methionine sulfoxide reductase [Caudoviricetes sp.]